MFSSTGTSVSVDSELLQSSKNKVCWVFCPDYITFDIWYVHFFAQNVHYKSSRVSTGRLVCTYKGPKPSSWLVSWFSWENIVSKRGYQEVCIKSSPLPYTQWHWLCVGLKKRNLISHLFCVFSRLRWAKLRENEDISFSLLSQHVFLLLVNPLLLQNPAYSGYEVLMILISKPPLLFYNTYTHPRFL